MPVGFRVFRRSRRPDAALLERSAGLNTADLSDAMNRSGTMDRGIAPVSVPMRRVVGPAVTVSAPTGAFNIVKIGMEQTRRGDVLVVNARGSLNGALVGGNVCRGLVHRGLAALIADGAVRDAGEIRRDGLPTFARGITTVMGPIDGPGEVNVPVACGGVVVEPGDIVVADEDGIVVIRPSDAEEVLAETARARGEPRRGPADPATR
ncbi:MAG TPA: RraA family protein [Candidatus Limnocylindria bacterium]|nr:RraA family protein [Candidatus Limnocylindria bacterium]